MHTVSVHIKVIKLICDSSAAVTFTLYHLQGFQIGCILTSALSHHHSVSLCLLHKHECQSIQLTKQLTAHWSHVLFSEDFKGTHCIFFFSCLFSSWIINPVSVTDRLQPHSDFHTIHTVNPKISLFECIIETWIQQQRSASLPILQQKIPLQPKKHFSLRPPL